MSADDFLYRYSGLKGAKEARAEVAQAATDNAALRKALIQCGRAAGALLADDVSTEFLMLIPSEVQARLEALSRGDVT